MSDIRSILEAYSAGPDQLRSLVAGLDAEAVDAIPIPGKWSVRQVVCHLTDFEIIGAERMKRVLAEDNPALQNADPGLYAQTQRYDRRDVGDELALIDGIRRHTRSILEQCDIEDFQRTGVHSVDGPLTLEALLERVTNHLPHHLRFIREKLAAL
ncbi:MAG: DinB family protein [Planctomycetaceae bacterium]|nr:DinB family protein [Planctomycetaceae bacterium]